MQKTSAMMSLALLHIVARLEDHKEGLSFHIFIPVSSRKMLELFLVQVLPAVSANKLSELQEMAG